jgi:predicted metal-dependent hydrolase
MPQRNFSVYDPLLKREVAVQIRRDKRLKRTVRWEQTPEGAILLRIPFYMPWRDVPALIERMEAELQHLAEKAARRTHDDLARRARAVNRKYFNGQVRWAAIRWVNNMEKRLGSVTLGGTTNRHIRISEKIRLWPEWVVDYVIAHEFVHLLLPQEGHSARFWQTLQAAYPLTERARGFIRGYFFAKGELDDQATEDTNL